MEEETGPTVSTSAPAENQPVKRATPWNELNLVSLLSLIFAVSGLGVGAIILGHIGLAQLKTKHAPGRGLAIAGLVIGYVEVVGWILFFLAYIVFFFIAILAAIAHGGMGYHTGYTFPHPYASSLPNA